VVTLAGIGLLSSFYLPVYFAYKIHRLNKVKTLKSGKTMQFWHGELYKDSLRKKEATIAQLQYNVVRMLRRLFSEASILLLN
jgi:hypothetical protein